jgi:hypothetical protein
VSPSFTHLTVCQVWAAELCADKTANKKAKKTTTLGNGDSRLKIEDLWNSIILFFGFYYPAKDEN